MMPAVRQQLWTVLGLHVAAAISGVQPASAQPQASQAATAQTLPPISVQPVPNELELSKLLWSTMAAIDHANRSGNYSVLRDMSAPGFREQNDPARLAQIFAGVRASRIDLSNALLLAPTYSSAPAIVGGNRLRLTGMFGLRPTAIAFDLHFEWYNGSWRLFGVSLAPRTIASQQPSGGGTTRR